MFESQIGHKYSDFYHGSIVDRDINLNSQWGTRQMTNDPDFLLYKLNDKQPLFNSTEQLCQSHELPYKIQAPQFPVELDYFMDQRGIKNPYAQTSYPNQYSQLLSDDQGSI